MDDIKVKGFAMRITQANQSELVVIMYDAILEYSYDAKEALTKQDDVEFVKSIKQMRGFLNELMASLNFSCPISNELMPLYRFADRQAVKAMHEKDSARLLEIENIFTILRSSFEELAKQDNRSAVMVNAEPVYVGLTYGRGNLDETVIHQNENRGFRA